MKVKSFKKFVITATSAAILSLPHPVLSDEKIIQKEKMSLEKCFKVISVSEDKLSVSPEISDVSEKKRIAIFSLSDGALKITCDGDKGFVIVSTKQIN